MTVGSDNMSKKMSYLLYTLIILMILMFVLQYFIPNDEYPNNFYGGNHMFGGSFFPIGMIGMVIFWLFVAMIAIEYFGHHKSDDTHIESLKKRLSRGEISMSEYEKIKEKLGE